MIKWIKSIWEKLFAKKEDVKEVVPVKIDHCGVHSRHKKSCPACMEAIKLRNDGVKNVIKCATAQMQKVNVPTVIAMVEKKTQPMKVVVSSLTTQENANHVNN